MADQPELPSQPADLRALVAEHAAFVYRYAFRLCGHADDAQDLAQQTFLIAQQKLDQLRTAACARAWLCAVLRHAWLRSFKRKRPVAAGDLEIEVDSLPAETPADWEIEPEELQQAIDDLPDDYKMVLLAFYFEQCSYRQIAERLELPLGTVMSRLARAKAFLRAKLVPNKTEQPTPAALVNNYRGAMKEASQHGGVR